MYLFFYVTFGELVHLVRRISILIHIIYIHSMRDKLDGNLKEFITDSDKDSLKSLMNDAEEWLYGDGFDSTKNKYSQRIDELRVLSDPVESRFQENQQRGIYVSS